MPPGSEYGVASRRSLEHAPGGLGLDEGNGFVICTFLTHAHLGTLFEWIVDTSSSAQYCGPVRLGVPIVLA
jgi:hypothetical protein